MKSFILQIICLCILSGFIVPNHNHNANTWKVYLNDKVLMYSYKNKPGSVLNLSLKTLRAEDTLGIHYNVCGDYEHQAGYVPALLFCRKDFKVVKTYYNFDAKNTGYWAGMPVSDMLQLLSAEKDFELYFTVDSRDTTIKPQLICKVQLR